MFRILLRFSVNEYWCQPTLDVERYCCHPKQPINQKPALPGPDGLPFTHQLDANKKADPAGSRQCGFAQQSVDLGAVGEGSKSFRVEQYINAPAAQRGQDLSLAKEKQQPSLV